MLCVGGKHASLGCHGKFEAAHVNIFSSIHDVSRVISFTRSSSPLTFKSPHYNREGREECLGTRLQYGQFGIGLTAGRVNTEPELMSKEKRRERGKKERNCHHHDSNPGHFADLTTPPLKL